MEAAPFDHAAILLACARGEQAAFHQLYDHEAPHMLALCRRLAPGEAEDLLHDTFALVWRNADHYDPRMGPARAWIYSVLRHLSHGRRIRRNEVPRSDAPPLPMPSAVRGEIGKLGSGCAPLAFETVAHAYLYGADYGRLSVWLRRSESELRRVTRSGLKGLAA